MLTNHYSQGACVKLPDRLPRWSLAVHLNKRNGPPENTLSNDIDGGGGSDSEEDPNWQPTGEGSSEEEMSVDDSGNAGDDGLAPSNCDRVPTRAFGEAL